MSTKKNTTAQPEITGTSLQSKIKSNYSSSSLIARAYSAGYFPNFTHQRLFHSIVKMLDGKNEGSIDFNALLSESQMHRSSAMQIIKHMVNWNILEVSFNSSQVIGEKRKSWLFVKIIRNPETQEDLPKSA